LVGVNMTADVVFTRAKVAVFVDGGFWHGCPEHYRKPAINKDYWEPKLLKNMARDGIADAALIAEGWTVIRAWEHEDPEAVADLVEAAVRRPDNGSLSTAQVDGSFGHGDSLTLA